MRTLSVTVPVLVLATLVAGCAQMRSGGGGTAAMGASPARQTVMCRDGAWKVNASECGNHGGVERAMASPSAK